jgi:hypothetical protein
MIIRMVMVLRNGLLALWKYLVDVVVLASHPAPLERRWESVYGGGTALNTGY